ncbi:MAG: O-antigen ligase family protein [Planctomycetota bacterium]
MHDAADLPGLRERTAAWCALSVLAATTLAFTPWSFDALALKSALLLALAPLVALALLAPRRRLLALLLLPFAAAGILCLLLPAQRLAGLSQGTLVQLLGILVVAAAALILGGRVSRLQTLGGMRVPAPLLAIAAIVVLGRLSAAGGGEGAARVIGVHEDTALLLLLVIALLVHWSFWSHTAVYLAAVLVLGLAVALLAILQKFGIDPYGTVNPGREAVSTFGNTNAAGSFLAPLFVLAGLLSPATRNARFLTGAAAVILGAGLILTQSRGSALAALAGIAVGALIAITGAGEPTPLSRLSVKLGLIVAASLLLAVAAGGMHVLRMKAIERSDSSILSPEYPTTKLRLAILGDTWRMIDARALLGHGPGSFRITYPRFQSPEIARLPGRLSVPVEVDHPHNDYALLAAERGVLAGALWLLLMGTLIRRAWLARGFDRAGPRSRLAAPLAGAIAALAVNGATFTILRDAATAVLTFVLAGMILAYEVEGPLAARSHVSRRLAGVGVSAFLLVALLQGSLGLASQVELIRVGMMEEISSTASFAAAHERLERAVLLDPANVEAARFHTSVLVTRSLQANQTGSWSEAAKRALSRLRARLPCDDFVEQGYGLLALLRGREHEAEVHFARASRLARGGPSAEERLRNARERIARSFPNASALPPGTIQEQATFLKDQGRFGEAKRLLDQHLQEHPADGDAWHLLGLVLREEGDEAGAERFLRRAQLVFAVEWILKREWERAATNLRIARRYTDDDAEERALEALVLLLQGKKGDALDRLRERGEVDFARFPGFVRDAVLPLERTLNETKKPPPR